MWIKLTEVFSLEIFYGTGSGEVYMNTFWWMIWQSLFLNKRFTDTISNAVCAGVPLTTYEWKTNLAVDYCWSRGKSYLCPLHLCCRFGWKLQSCCCCTFHHRHSQQDQGQEDRDRCDTILGQPSFKVVAYASGTVIDFTSATSRKHQLDASLQDSGAPPAKAAPKDLPGIDPTSSEELDRFFDAIQ